MIRKYQAVSCVLRNVDRILMLKRSSKVRTNKGLWSIVAGEVIDDTYSTAITEIEEETGLSTDDVIFIKKGHSVEISLSPESTTSVFPFLFHTEETNIKINWEHDEYRWIVPNELKELTLVPRFYDILLSLGLNDFLPN